MYGLVEQCAVLDDSLARTKSAIQCAGACFRVVSVGISFTLADVVIAALGQSGAASISQVVAIQASNVSVTVSNLTCTACVSAEVVSLFTYGEHTSIVVSGLRVANAGVSGDPALLQSVVRSTNTGVDNLTVSDINVTCYGTCVGTHASGARQILFRNVRFASVGGGSTVLSLTNPIEGGVFLCESCFLDGAVVVSAFSSVAFVASVFADSKLTVERCSGTVALRSVRWLPSATGDAVTIANGRNQTVTLQDVTAVATLNNRRIDSDFLSFWTTIGSPMATTVVVKNVNCTAFSRLVVINQFGPHDITFDSVALNGTSLVESMSNSATVRVTARNVRSTGALRGQLMRLLYATNITVDNLLVDIDNETLPLGTNTFPVLSVSESCESVQLSNWSLRGVSIAAMVSVDMRVGAAVNCTVAASQITLRSVTTSQALFFTTRNLTVSGLTITESRLNTDEAIRFTSREASLSDVTLRNVSIERPFLNVRNVAAVTLHRWLIDGVVMRSPSTPLLALATGGSAEPERFDVADVRLSNMAADRFLRLEGNDRAGSAILVTNVTVTNVTASSELIRVTSTPVFSLTNTVITRCTSPAMIGIAGAMNVTLARVSVATFDRYAIDANDIRNLTVSDLAISNGTTRQGGVAGPLRFVRVLAAVIERALVSGNDFTMGAADSCGGIRFESSGGTGTIVVRDSVFERNRAIAAGALLIASDQVRVERCRFTGNNSTQLSPGGSIAGALYIESARGAVNDSIFVGNAAASGGAVHVAQSTLVLGGLRVWDNAARVRGGGLMVRSSNVAVDASLLRNNSAQQAGGGIAATDSTLAIRNLDIVGSVSGNGNAARGGAIDVDLGGAVISVANTTVIGTRIFGLNNSATGAVGFLSTAFVTINDSCFCDTRIAAVDRVESEPVADLSCRAPIVLTNVTIGSSSIVCSATGISTAPCVGACPRRVPMLATEAPAPTQPLTLPPQSQSNGVGDPSGVTDESGAPTGNSSNIDSSNNSNNNNVVPESSLDPAVLGGAIGGALGAVLILSIVGAVCVARRRRRQQQQEQQPATEVASVGTPFGGDTVVTAESVSSGGGTELKAPIYTLLPPSRTIDAGYDETGNLEAMPM